VTIDQLRQTREHLQERWRVAFPLAERHLSLLGGHVMDRAIEGVDIEYPATQPAFPELAMFATEVFEYDSLESSDQDAAWAVRFYPAGTQGPLMVDPRFAGGAVTFLERGVTLENVISRWNANEPIDFIASDLQLDPANVSAALQYAGVA